MSGPGVSMSPSAASALLGGPLSELPLAPFLSALSVRHGLGLTEREVERSAQVLQEQWFNHAEELRMVDLEALSFLPLAKQLGVAIHQFFQPNYNPAAKYPPGGGAPPSASPQPSVSPAPAHTDGARAANANGVHSRAASSSSASSSAAAMDRRPSPLPAASAASASALASGSEGGLKAEGGELDEDSQGEVSGSGSGSGSSESDDSYSDDSQLRGDDEHDDPSALPDSGASGKRRKKKWDRHSSLVALSKAVDHVCASATRDEAVLASLQAILRNAMAKSGRHTQNTLRELMKKLQDKQAGHGGADAPAAAAASASVDDLGLRLKGLHVAPAGKSGPPPSAASASSSSLALTSSSSSPVAASVSPSSSSYGHVCGLCHSAQDAPIILQDCDHEFCRSCMQAYINDHVGRKKAVGIVCPWTPARGAPGVPCSCELSTGTIQSVLSPPDFESYLNATLMSFIESDDCLTVTCPNAKCNSIMSVEPLANRDVPTPIQEKDDDGKVMTKETFLHFKEFRVRCRECHVNFCAKCRAQPYHKGYTCASFKEYQASRHCRFCSAKLSTEESLRASNGVRDVCSQAECQAKSLICCDKTLKCGCACNGIRNEAECLPCLKHELEIDEDEYCGICYVEGLKDAPCLQLKGPCTHVFHYSCLLKKLESRWPGARVGFEFKGCPVCKQEMKHPALREVLAPINALEADIQEKALMRLKFEGRDKDGAIVNANGAFHNDPVGFAMKQYLFYMCFKCNKPYFAGGYQCQEANQAFDPAELVCPGCQPQSVEDCAVHGRDWLAYKCRYCCSYATWTCWSTTHFCDVCHKSGVWQGLAVFRTGKNKKKIWEYPQCASLQKPVEDIGKESGTEEEKNAKLAKLLCAPRSCPLGIRHPPNGIEFGLGCSMCEDKQSIGDAQAAQEAIRSKLHAVRSELQKAGSKKFAWSGTDFDQQGVCWYLGTCANTQPWSNPAEAGFIKISSSGCMDDSAPLSALVGRDLVRLVSKPVRHSWFLWDLLDLQLCLSHYTLKHYNSWDTECLRSWTLEGSNDGQRWDVLVTHSNDASLDRKGATHTWKVDSYGRKYSMFKIMQTGRNSNNNFYLALSGSEFYGELSLAPPKPQLLPGGAPAPLPLALPVANAQAAANVHRLQFIPKYDFDNNGIIHYLGTACGKAAWRNPVELGLVHVACSELGVGPPMSAPASALCGKEVVRCVSAAKPNQWFVIDLTPSGKCVRPSHYSLRHYSSWDIEALRNWRFEGSINGFEWMTLSVHSNDTSLDKKGATHTWALPGCTVLCTMFRILHTGLNSNNHHYLACSGFEVYGVLEDVSPALAQYQRELLMGARQPFAAGAAQQPQLMAAPAAVAGPVPALHRGLQPFQQHPLPPPSAGVLLPSFASAPPSQADSGVVVLRYRSDFDEHGAFYWLGTAGLKQPWRNPADLGRVAVRASELATAPPSQPANALCGREVVRCCTVGKENMYFIVDLRDKLLMPTHYSLRHYISYDTEALRNWTLEGSVSGQKWDLLRVHRDDKALLLKGSTATWPLQPTGHAYRMFRITQTGPNSNNNFYMCCSGMELYGLMQLWPQSGPEARERQAAVLGQGMRGDSVDMVRAAQQEFMRMAHQRPAIAAPSQPQPPYGAVQQPVAMPAIASHGYPGAMAHAIAQPAPSQVYGYAPQQAAAVPSQPAHAMVPVPSQPLLPAAAVVAPPAASGVAGPPGPVLPGSGISGPPPYQEFQDGMEFSYVHDLDANGILYWLGTQRWTKPWQNPAELGVVQVTSVPLAIAPRSEPASAIVGRSLCRCVTLPNRESWFVIDLINIWRDWKLQGSNDGKKWTKLLSHKKDESLNRRGASHTWPIPKPKRAYRMFRILQTGKNSNNHWYCALSSVEFYGKVYSFKK